MNTKIKIFRELENFCERCFKGRDYFVLVYGSYASDDFTDESDLDLFVATDKHNKADFKKLCDFVIGLHIRNNLKINEEVPYENKLIVSYDDAMSAFNLKAFPRKKSGYIIPPVTADKKFLASKEVRFRIILNALTSPNQFICGSSERYNLFKKRAESAIIKLAYGIAGTKKLTKREILDILLRGPNGEKSGDYLGYRDYRPRVVSYLKKLISINI